MESKKTSLSPDNKQTVFRLPSLNLRLAIGIFLVVVFLSIACILYDNAISYNFLNRSNFMDPSKNTINIQSFIKNGIAQNDSRIVDYIRKHHLFPPSTLPYNLTDMTGDPGAGSYYNGQNVVVKKILKNMTNGYFVDVGAHDGEYISNTLALERDFNWTGLLIEPSPVELKNLKSKHRKAWIADVCLSPTTSPSTFEYLHKEGYTIANKLRMSETDSDVKKGWKLFRLQCFPLFSILSALGIKEIDYFSLDIEGIELRVLNTIPFDSVFIKVISVEWNLIPEGKDALDAFLKTKGYIVAQEVYHDHIYFHKSLNYTNSTEVKHTG